MKRTYDTIILGGGIVGLLTAKQLAKTRQSVLVVEKNTIGSKLAASSGTSRSLRNDYRKPLYSKLARKSWGMWSELEKELDAKLVIRTGCLNICDDTLDKNPYARQSTDWLKRDGNPYREFTNSSELESSFGQFDAIDYAVLDEEAGMCLAAQALARVRDRLDKQPNVTILENTQARTISVTQTGLDIVLSDDTEVSAKKLVVAAGLGTPEIIEKIKSAKIKLTLTPDRPVECLYYEPSDPADYTAEKFPIFANLDVGVYGHPIIPGVTKAVKIGMYAPPEIVTGQAPRSVSGVKEFVGHYLPDLAATSKITSVTDTDQCSYDMTSDSNFIIGSVPGASNVIVACGFNGTGFKFAPVTSDLVVRLVQGKALDDDILAFNPARFLKGEQNEAN